MTHPSSLDLEAFACGEATPPVESHLGECAACSAFVERLRGARSTGPSHARASDVVARAAARAGGTERTDATPPAVERKRTPEPARDVARRRWFMTASTVAVPLAAAAALLLLVRTPETKDTLAPAASPPAIGDTTAATADLAPETTFKGDLQIAVIRERAGQQARFTNKVEVRPGDRLRVEVALDREQVILAAVMDDDARWLELMPEAVRRPGTHFSERSARVDATPVGGTVIAGSAEAVTRARSTKRFEGVATVRIEWEAP